MRSSYAAQPYYVYYSIPVLRKVHIVVRVGAFQCCYAGYELRIGRHTEMT